MLRKWGSDKKNGFLIKNMYASSEASRTLSQVIFAVMFARKTDKSFLKSKIKPCR